MDSITSQYQILCIARFRGIGIQVYLKMFEDLIRPIFNFSGACIRWAFGSLWRKISNKPSITFNEYLNGPKKAYDKYDDYDESINIIVGVPFILVVLYIIVSYFIM